MTKGGREGFGNLRKLPSGRWNARYEVDGVEHNRTFSKKADADSYLAEVRTDLRRGEWVDPRKSGLTLSAFVDKHYAATMINLSPSTRARDESYLRTHIIPVFGHRQLVSIDYSDVQAWVNELTTRKAPATVVKASQILGKIMKTAVRSRHLSHDPTMYVVLPRIEESEDVYLTPAQVRDLAEAMTRVSPRFRALIFAGCYLGPRIGELLALRWSDLDELHRRITIARKVVEVSGLGNIEGATKTRAGRRVVTVPKLVMAELLQHRDQFGGSDLIFTTAAGTQLRANNLRRREWATAVMVAGLNPVPTFHDMRHTAVALWVAAGATDLQVATWAGHRSVSFTKDRYARLFPEHGDALADALDGFISTATTTPAAAPVRLVQ